MSATLSRIPIMINWAKIFRQISHSVNYSFQVKIIERSEKYVQKNYIIWH